MNLYEFEGKQLFVKYDIAVPRGVIIRRDDDVVAAYTRLGITDVVVKAQVLSGKRGKNNGIRFCSNADASKAAVEALFSADIRGQYVAAVRIEEKINIAEEHYLSITYDTNRKMPLLIYSREGGGDIEDIAEEKIERQILTVISTEVEKSATSKYAASSDLSTPLHFARDEKLLSIIQNMWTCFLREDARVVEINPLVKTVDGQWIAVDAKVAIDDDAFFRHEAWQRLESRTQMGRPATEREVAARKIDEGEKYYQGTASKYIDMDGDIATLFAGGGASIANIDALLALDLQPANYTEYSGNPPREKVRELTKIVLSKPGLRGLWVCGAVSNFTNVKETFLGIIDALDEVKPAYPIVVRRDGPEGEVGRQLLKECAERHGLRMKIFGKEVSMSETAKVLAEMINSN